MANISDILDAKLGWITSSTLDQSTKSYLGKIGLAKALQPWVKWKAKNGRGFSIPPARSWQPNLTGFDLHLELTHPLVQANPFREELVQVYNQLYYLRLIEGMAERKQQKAQEDAGD